MGHRELAPFEDAVRAVLDRFAAGATAPEEHPPLAQLQLGLRTGVAVADLEAQLRQLNFDGYLRGALVLIAESLLGAPRAGVALMLARELMDALDPQLGISVARAVTTLESTETDRLRRGGPWIAANDLIAEALEDRGDPRGALRHYEAVLSADVDDTRALHGWSRCVQALERRGISVEHRSRGLALLDGVGDLELEAGLGTDRYELGRPLGRGRHAVVYEAHDRRVGRDVAIKRLLADAARTDQIPTRVLESRFFAEARTLARVRSPWVVALLDAQPRHRYIALDLCRGGSLRLALRRRSMGPEDVPRIAQQLQAALRAVHAVGAVHRDIKPANILIRDAGPGAPIALADFGLAIPTQRGARSPKAGTLRYLAPELRRGHAATPASDLYSAGVVLLELALAPKPLPREFDRIDGVPLAAEHIPEHVEPQWAETLTRLLAVDPEARTW